MIYGIDKLTAIPVIITRQQGNQTHSTNVDYYSPLPVQRVYLHERSEYSGSVNANSTVSHSFGNLINAEKVVIAFEYASSANGVTINGELSINRIVEDSFGISLTPTSDNDDKYTFSTNTITPVSLVINTERIADEFEIKIKNLSSTGTLSYRLVLVVLR